MKIIIIIVFLFIFSLQPSPIYSSESRQKQFQDSLELSAKGDFGNALIKWDQYLEKFPEDAAALSNRGNVKLVVGDPKGAINDQDKAIDLNSEELDPYINRGIAKESLGLWLEAIRDYEFVISKDKHNFSALYTFDKASAIYEFEI